MSHTPDLLSLLPQHAVNVFRLASMNRRVFEISLAGVLAVPQSVAIEDSDRELIERVHAGDEKAFGLLYDRHSKMAYSTALRILKSPVEAEDVLQDVFLQIWRTPPQVREDDFNLHGWISVVIRNRSLSVLRAHANHRSVSLENFDFASPYDLESEAEQLELYTKAEQVANVLAPEEQRILKMCFDEEMTHSAISALTAIPLGTVKSRVRHALLVLRKTLEARHS